MIINNFQLFLRANPAIIPAAILSRVNQRDAAAAVSSQLTSLSSPWLIPYHDMRASSPWATAKIAIQ